MDWKEILLSADRTQFSFGNKAIFKQYLEAQKFHEPGIAPVCDETGWYHINTNGEPLYASRYLKAFGFYERIATVVNEKGFFQINSSGIPLSNKLYKWAGNFQESKCVVRSNNTGSYYHIDLAGARIYPHSYLYAGDFKDGFACAKTVNGWQHIDKTGNPLNGRFFLDLNIFHKGFAIARDQKGWFHINIKGEELYRNRYRMIEPFYNGVALVHDDNYNSFLIGETGELA